ncbi:MAG: Gfo/Idh/MocA family protein [Planctomycetales bacterium]
MPLQLAMLGMWHVHADGIVRQVAAHPDEFRLIGFHDADPAVVAARREAWGQLIPGFHLCDSAEELLRLPIDGVVVEGRVYENLRLARQVLAAGHPVLLEKPAGVDLEEHRQMADLARRRGLHVQMIYLFRYMSALQELLRRARRGDLGSIYEFRGRLPKDLSLYQALVEELRPYRGGVFFEMAGHLIDLMVALLGRPRRITPFLAHHHTDEPTAFIDHGVALFEFDRAFGIVEVPALEVAPRSRRIEVYGTGGACVIEHLGSGHLENNPRQPIDVCQRGAAEWRRLDLPAATLQIADLREFAAVLGGKKPPDFSLEHDLIVQESLLAASGMS